MELWYTEEPSENTRFSVRVNRQLCSVQTPFQRIDILESSEVGRFLTLDGQIMLTEKDEFIYHEMMVHVPMAVNPGIQNVLVIGGGDGGSVRELTRYGGVKHIDLVEIDKMVVDACREYLPQTACKLDDPRVTLHFEEGLRFVRTEENVYDLILVDSTDSFGPGEELFTKEFYGNCYKALTENGILINQYENPCCEKYIRSVRSANQHLTDFFPVCRTYLAHAPTYPFEHLLFGFASKKYDPLDFDAAGWNHLGLQTKYYNTDIHTGSFALPNDIRELLAGNDR